MIRKKKQDYIARLVSALKKRSEIQRVILFGSTAKGKRGNDIDIIVIGDFSGKLWERRLRLFETLKDILQHIDIDMIPLTESEFKKLLSEGDPFMTAAMTESREIYRG